MKKLSTILAIMMVIVGSVFATTGDTLYVTATVAKVQPAFTMYGGTTTSYGSEGKTGGKVAANTVAAGNPATANIDVYIKIEQNNKSFYKDETGFDLTITATALKLDGTSTTYLTNAPKATLDTEVTDTDHLVITQSGANSNVVTYNLKYPTGVPVAAATVIGTFKFTWDAKDTLPVGNYEATITLAYTAN